MQGQRVFGKRSTGRVHLIMRAVFVTVGAQYLCIILINSTITEPVGEDTITDEGKECDERLDYLISLGFGLYGSLPLHYFFEK